jgi:hypothetical protein
VLYRVQTDPRPSENLVRSRLRLVPVLIAAFVLGATLALRVGVPASNAEISSTLHASVGPDFQISLTFDDGSRVTQIPAGTYTVVVNDAGTEHNFHLLGAGVDLATSIEATEQPTWTVTFADATGYQFRCDRHPNTLNGSFNVGNVPVVTAAPTPAPAPAPAALVVATPLAAAPVSSVGVASFIGTLNAAVTATGTIELTKSGKRITSLPQGSYHLVISDSGKRDDLTVRQISGAKFSQRFTTATFIGKKQTAITLVRGLWKAYSSGREAATSQFFKVTG